MAHASSAYWGVMGWVCKNRIRRFFRQAVGFQGRMAVRHGFVTCQERELWAKNQVCVVLRLEACKAS